jgi:hypothetical protein
MSGTSEVPRPAHPLCAPRESAEVGREEKLELQFWYQLNCGIFASLYDAHH